MDGPTTVGRVAKHAAELGLEVRDSAPKDKGYLRDRNGPLALAATHAVILVV